ncbi:MAG: aminotransferase class V-fold PLP-dependent enzyme, partial [Oscillospiraceae bacterium]|nr:aminotransferase class V-fold PLP-dependent enzyme [Oscillospiraceae bacterium]
MTTPICDFVQQYARNNALRMHMPGHKGVNLLGFEKLDITEFDGADNLYEPNGIIAQSEANATAIFGCDTFYSTEGSSQCIRAMLYLVCMDAKAKGEKPLVAAGRNAHKTFLNAAALLDFDIVWLCGEKQNSYLSCNITAEYLEQFLNQTKPTAVYITSPDYLGNVADIKAIAEVCHKYGALLVVDNAHGAYLKFLPQSLHPIDLGADLCCDSAHKT